MIELMIGMLLAFLLGAGVAILARRPIDLNENALRKPKEPELKFVPKDAVKIETDEAIEEWVTEIAKKEDARQRDMYKAFTWDGKRRASLKESDTDED